VTTTIDARGTLCPVPVIELAKAVRGRAAGDLVVVLADDPAAATDIPAWCRMRGHDLVEVSAAEDGNGGRRYVVRVTPT
jgi:tRNA 2-thiouridine synthesizing protein A